MEFKEVNEKRRSIRSFTKKRISDKDIFEILNAGHKAPSAKNRQPWRFVILKTVMKDVIGELLLQHVDENIVKNSLKGSGNAIKQCDTLIVILKPNEDEWNTSDNLSIGACVQNILLSATEKGIGSLWIRDTSYLEKEILTLLKEDTMVLSCVIALGYPNEFPKRRPRKHLDDVIDLTYRHVNQITFTNNE